MTTSPSYPDLVQAALGYAALGWPIIPIHTVRDNACSCGKPDCPSPGKHPRTRHGLKDATTDPLVIEQYWKRWPVANIGVRTGQSPPGAGILTLDIDPRHGGDKSLDQLIQEHGEPPKTIEAITGGGGRHFVFAYPPDHGGSVMGNRSNLLPGIDVRGDEGYIVVAPSVHASSQLYRWRDGHSPETLTPTPMPTWLLDMIWGTALTTSPASLTTPPAGLGHSDTSEACLTSLLRIRIPDHHDGSKRLYTAACRCVEHNLTDSEAIAVIRMYTQLRPFPKIWSDSQIITRLRDAERVTCRGQAVRTTSHPTALSSKSINAKSKPIKPFVPFPVEFLPEPVASFVRCGSEAIGCDPSFLALPLLVGFASAIGNSRRIQLKRGWTEPAILWGVCIGESGCTKSPALELALRAVRRRQERLMREYQEAFEQWKLDFDRYEAEKVAWKKNATKNPETSGDPPTVPPQPIFERCWADDVTIEAQAKLLQDNPRGVLMIRDELSGWLHFDRYTTGKGKGSETAKWLEMFHGRALMVDRKTTGTIYVPQASVSIIGGIQPGVLSRHISQEHRDNGLLARLLLTMPPRRAKQWTETDIDPGAEAKIVELFDNLYNLKPARNSEGEPRPAILTMRSSGKRTWVRFYNEHNQQQVDLIGDLAAAWSKLEGYTARLALVHHLVRYVAQDTRNPVIEEANKIDEVSVQAGITLSRWFAAEARRVYARLDEDQDAQIRRGWVENIERRGGAVTVRDWRRSRSHPTTQDAEAELVELVTFGLGRLEVTSPGSKGGRPSKQFVLNQPAPQSSVNSNPSVTLESSTRSESLEEISEAVAQPTTTPMDRSEPDTGEFHLQPAVVNDPDDWGQL